MENHGEKSDECDSSGINVFCESGRFDETCMECDWELDASEVQWSLSCNGQL